MSDRICPKCRNAIPDDDLFFCAYCGTAYHLSCWKNDPHCLVPGCPATTANAPVIPQPITSQIAPPSPNPQPQAASFPGAPAAPASEASEIQPQTAPFPGSPAAPASAPLGAQMPAAPAAPPKKNSKTIVIVLCIVAAVVLIGGAITGFFVIQTIRENQRKQEMADYAATAESFYLFVLDRGVTLENVGNEMKSNWYDYVYNRYSYYDSPNEAVQDAHDSMSDELASIESTAALDFLYEALMDNPDPENPSLVKIQQASKDVWDKYHEFYDFILNPEGNFTSFVSDFKTLDEETLDALTALSDATDDFYLEYPELEDLGNPDSASSESAA